MTISFSRSLRSLQNDSFHPSIAGLLITSILLAAWASWFFFSSIPIVETSTEFSLARDGALLVTYPAAVVERIQPGQNATVRIQGSPEGDIEAVVLDVDPKAKSGQVKVFLYASEPLKGKPTGDVRIETEVISPAMLVLRTTAGNGLINNAATNGGSNN